MYLDLETGASATSGISKMASFEPSAWKDAMLSVKSQFQIVMLLPEQDHATRAFMEKANLFVNLITNEFNVFPLLPISLPQARPRCSSVMVVISPLKTLMNDQVEYLGNFGILVINIQGENDPEITRQVKIGTYTLVYCSQECMLIVNYDLEGNFS